MSRKESDAESILDCLTDSEELAMDIYMEHLAGKGDVKDLQLFNDCLTASEHIIQTLLERHEDKSSNLKVVFLK